MIEVLAPFRNLFEYGGRKPVLAENGGDFVENLKKRGITEFSVRPQEMIINGGRNEIHRFVTVFSGTTLSEVVLWNLLQIEVGGKMAPGQKKLHLRRATKTAERDLELFLRDNGKNLGGMEIDGPMAGMTENEIQKIEGTEPFGKCIVMGEKLRF